MRKPSLLQLFAAFSVFLLLAILYYHEMISWLPRGMHNWAQADRYSLALNFYDRGMNFLRPATNSEWSKDGITAPEFPMQSYLAAVLAKIFGRSNTSILFRLITLSFSAGVFLVLFYWSKKISGNFFISLLTPVFLFTSPVFIYYSCNYLPDTASASLILISFYYLFSFNQTLAVRNGLMAIFFAGAATLIKTSSGIYFAAICMHGMIIVLQHFKFFGTRIILLLAVSVFISGLAIGGYLIHIQQVEHEIHSGIFLTATRPIDKTLYGYSGYLKEVFKNWKYHYLTQLHYLILSIAALLILISIRRWKSLRFYFIQFLLNIAAAITGFSIMGGQFYIHDYYAIAILFPAVVFIVIFFVQIISEPPFTGRDKLFTIILTPAMIFMCALAFYKHLERIGDRGNDGWFTDLKTPLEEFGVGRNEKILITSGDPPNLGLVYADRRGLTTDLSTHYSNPNYLLQTMRENDLKYLVMGHLQADTLKRQDSCFFKYLDPVTDNYEVAIYKFRGTIEDQYWTRTPDDKGLHPRFTAFTSFEFPFNCEQMSAVARTGNYSLSLSKDAMFMPQLHVSSRELPDTSLSDIMISFWVKPETPGHLNLVAQSVMKDSTIDYQLVQLNVPMINDSSWNQITSRVPFPKMKGVANAVEIYLWNQEGITVYVDDFSVQFGE